jgi:hypothetical protein
MQTVMDFYSSTQTKLCFHPVWRKYPPEVRTIHIQYREMNQSHLLRRLGFAALRCQTRLGRQARGIHGQAPPQSSPGGGATNFSFSGCGWLTCWHMGAAEALHSRGHLTADSLVAGASGGSLAAAAIVCEIPPEDGLQMQLDLGRYCRVHGTVGNIEPSLR